MTAPLRVYSQKITAFSGNCHFYVTFIKKLSFSQYPSLTMLQLKKTEPFATGGRRACYFHPDNPELCVKVARPDKHPSILRSVDPIWKRLRPVAYYDENLLDLKVQQIMEAKLGNTANAHFPKTQRLIKTDLGLGLVCELIRDHDGRISLSGKEFIMQHGFSNATDQALEELKNFITENFVLFRDPFPHNIVFQSRADGSLRAVIIDGLDRRVFLYPLFKKAAQKRAHKKFNRLMKGFKQAEKNAKNGIPPKSNGILLRR
jgi:hypothetical protein